MDLIHDDMAHALQAGVALQLPQQDAHGAEEQGPATGRGLALQPYLKPTFRRKEGPSSWLTRCATDTAEMRRG